MVRVQIPVAATKGEHVSILTLVEFKLFKLITWAAKTVCLQQQQPNRLSF